MNKLYEKLIDYFNQYVLSSANLLLLLGILTTLLLLILYLFFKLIFSFSKTKKENSSDLLYLKYSLPGENRKHIHKR